MFAYQSIIRRNAAARLAAVGIAAGLLGSSANAALVSACTGVSLPRSAVTGIIAGPLNGIVTPLQGTVNTILGIPILGGLGGPPLSIDVAGLLTTAAAGAPITLQAIATDGTLVGPADNCQVTGDSFQLDTPAGIALGGNRISGLGDEGLTANAGNLSSIALGNSASTAAGATNAIALGSDASVTASNSVAIGANSTATRGANVGYAAPGVAGPQNSVGEVSVGSPGAERQITNVAPGSAPTDAVNVAQVSAAITASAGAAPVQYSNPGTPTTPNGGVPTNDVTLVGGASGPVTVHNVAPGAVTAGSTDAVDGGQLFTTNQNVATNTTNIAGNTTSITNLNNGTAGIVRQVGGAPGAGTITVGAQTAGTLVDITGTGGVRTLTGLAPGAVNAASSDAVNGSQLFATNGNVTNLTTNINNGTIGLVQQTGGAPGAGQITVGAATGGTSVSVAGTSGDRVVTGVAAGVAPDDAVNVSQLTAIGAASANAVLYDTVGGVRQNTVTLIGGGPGTVRITNVTPATLSAGSTDAVNGSQLFATNTNVANNTTNIANNTTAITNLNNGTAGLVQQVGGAPGSGLITVGAATGGTTINVSGTGGTRTVTGVTAGAVTATSTDAVNGAQLFATNAQVTNNTNAVTNLTTNINNGSVGLVQQTGGAPGAGTITVGAATGGTTINVAGTGGDRIITGVAPGLAANDAATVGQLAMVSGGSFNAVQYDTDGTGGRLNSVTLIGGAPGAVRIGNVAPGTIAAGSTDAVNGGQLAALTGTVAGNTTTINQIVNGQAGAFRSDNSAGAAAASATGANASAGGFGASATGSRSVAIGNSSTSTGTNSVAIGAGSTDGGVANVVSIGGVGTERRLTNVGPGLNGTDAVNLAQLQAQTANFQTTTTNLQNQINGLDFDISRTKRRANAGTAGAMAVAALPQAFSEGAGMVGGAVGYWQNQVAFAVGVSKIIGDSTVVKAGAAVSGRGTGGFNAGVGFQF